MSTFSFKLLCVTVASVQASKSLVTIDNTLPRMTSTGSILDGHDGRINKFSKEGPYWLHTISYGMCREPEGQGCNKTFDKCGFQFDHNITIWTSPDLSSGSWEYVGLAINYTDRAPGTIFRPDLVYNPNTAKYVLWFNALAPNGTYLGYTAFTAPQPAGPFTLAAELVPLSHAQGSFHGGDFHIFVDDDGTGYVIYSANHYMFIDKLSPDYLSASGPNDWVALGPYFVEAPMLLKNGTTGVYYALFDHCCCYCYQGSGIRVFTSTTPLANWTEQGSDLACEPPSLSLPYMSRYGARDGPITPEPTPGQGCLYNGSTTVSTTRSQQSQVAVVDTPTGPLWVWIGDRWQQAPDGVKGHDPQYWVPLTTDSAGVIQPVQWVDSFTMDVI